MRRFFIVLLISICLITAILAISLTTKTDRIRFRPLPIPRITATTTTTTTYPGNIECIDSNGFKIRTGEIEAEQIDLDCPSP